MQIVIDISEHLYKCLKKRIELGVNTELDLIVAKGKLLPRHGRLIDADKVLDDMSRAWVTGGARSVMQGYVAKSPTVIEADKAESEEEDD